MLDLKTRYPQNTPDSPPEMPFGKARDSVPPGSKTGFPHQADWINDIFGFLQHVAVNGRVTPNNIPDNVSYSRYAQAFFATYRLGGYKAFDPTVIQGNSPDTKGYSTLEHSRVSNYDPPAGDIRKFSALSNGGVTFGGSPPPGDANVGLRREVYDMGLSPVWSVGTDVIAGTTRQVYSYDAGVAQTPVVFSGIPNSAKIHRISFAVLAEGPPGTRLWTGGSPLSFTVDYTDPGGWPILKTAFAIAAHDGGNTGTLFYVDWDPS